MPPLVQSSGTLKRVVLNRSGLRMQPVGLNAAYFLLCSDIYDWSPSEVLSKSESLKLSMKKE